MDLEIDLMPVGCTKVSKCTAAEEYGWQCDPNKDPLTTKLLINELRQVSSQPAMECGTASP